MNICISKQLYQFISSDKFLQVSHVPTSEASHVGLVTLSGCSRGIEGTVFRRPPQYIRAKAQQRAGGAERRLLAKVTHACSGRVCLCICYMYIPCTDTECNRRPIKAWRSRLISVMSDKVGTKLGTCTDCASFKLQSSHWRWCAPDFGMPSQHGLRSCTRT